MDIRINRPTLDKSTMEENIALVDTWIADTADKLNAFVTSILRQAEATAEGNNKMSARIKTLEDENGTSVYPTTTADAVYMPGSRDTVYNEILDLRGANATITFNTDGSIVKEMESGKTSTTVFNQDGSITETCIFTETQELYYTKTTTFNADGSITIKMVYAE